MIGPRILSTPDSPVVGCAAPTGLVRDGSAWLVVKRGRVVARFEGMGAKREAIRANGGSNVVAA